MMSNCICYDNIHNIDKILENKGSEGQNSFSAHPTLSQKRPPREFAIVFKSFLSNQKRSPHINKQFGMQYGSMAALLRSWD